MTGIIDRASALIRMARPVIGLIAGFGAVAAYTLVSPHPHPTQMLCLAVVLLAATSGGFILNDVMDLEKDCICHPERPLPRGEISPPLAAVWGAFFLVCAVIFAIPLGKSAMALVGINVLLLAAYSRILLVDGFLGNLITSYLAASIVLLVIFVSGHGGHLLSAGIAVFLLMLSREIVFDIRDLPGDSVAGVRSLAARFGKSRALLAAWIISSLWVPAVLIDILCTTPRLPGLIVLIASMLLTGIAMARLRWESPASFDRFVILTRWSFVFMIFGWAWLH